VRILSFASRRLALMLPILALLVSIAFLISHVLPGDPVGLAAGEAAPQSTVEHIRHEFGLDKPLWQQYVIFWKDLGHGDLGRSLETDRPVTRDIRRFLPATIELGVVAFVIAVLVGVSLGAAAAVHYRSRTDHFMRVLAISGVSVPVFWLAILVQIVAASTHALPISGRLDILSAPPPHVTGSYLLDSLIAGQWGVFVDALKHIILPALTLGVPIIALTQRMTRAVLLDVLHQDYVTNGFLAAGLPRTLVYGRYALKNALIPVTSQLALNLGGLMAGSMLVETVFNWPGVGLYIVTASQYDDFQPILGGVLVTGVVFVLVGLCADVLYSVLDPRVEL
jgi:peptide/nickel transport system permease protein